MNEIKDGLINVFGAPPLEGLGTAGGFKLVVEDRGDRGLKSLQAVADCLREHGNYRWVGLYDVNRQAGMVVNIVWSGPGAPEYPTFAIAKGLTGV